MIGWNLYVIGDVTNGNRAVKLARILGGCIPLDSMSSYHKKRCDAAIALGRPLNRLGWFVLHVVNGIFFPGTIAWEYLHERYSCLISKFCATTSFDGAAVHYRICLHPTPS